MPEPGTDPRVYFAAERTVLAAECHEPRSDIGAGLVLSGVNELRILQSTAYARGAMMRPLVPGIRHPAGHEGRADLD